MTWSTAVRRAAVVAAACAVLSGLLIARQVAESRTPALAADLPAGQVGSSADVGSVDTSDVAVLAQLRRWGMPTGRATTVGQAEARRAVCAWREFTGRSVHRQRLTGEQREAIVAGPNKVTFPVPKPLRRIPVLINQVCQTLTYQESGTVVRVLPVSTGKYRGSSRNGRFLVYGAYPGWQSSTMFPDPSGEPNMYRALYFSGPLAIHGSNHPIRPVPESSGCTRTDPDDQDWLVRRLHIGDPVYSYGNWWVGRTRPFGPAA